MAKDSSKIKDSQVSSVYFIIELERNAIIFLFCFLFPNVTYIAIVISRMTRSSRVEVESYRESSFLPNDSRTLCNMPTIIVATITSRGCFDISQRCGTISPPFFPSFFSFFPFFPFPPLLLPRSSVGTMTGIIRVSSRCYQLRPSSDVTLRISKRFVS